MTAHERTGRFILVVDDEPAITKLLQMVLEADGHQVIVADDGQSALDRVDERRPDLVILDIASRSTADSRSPRTRACCRSWC
jgi:DNA-binding response OmpR family regulator